MAKLYQHQSDETYYTRLNLGGYVTRQIHPDGVAYLKYCGVRVGDEIPSYSISELRAYGWLFTKEEVPFWGAVDWAPRWTSIQPRSLRELTPFRPVPSVNDWLGNNRARSAADELEDEIRRIRAGYARRNEERWQATIAELEAKRQASRKAHAESLARLKMTPAPAVAKTGATGKVIESAAKDAKPDLDTRKQSIKSTTGSDAREKAKPMAKKHATADGKLVNSPITAPVEQARPSASTVGLAAKAIKPAPGRRSSIDPVPAAEVAVTEMSEPPTTTAITLQGHPGISVLAPTSTAGAVGDAVSRPAWMPVSGSAVPPAAERNHWGAMLAPWTPVMWVAFLAAVGLVWPVAWWLSILLMGLLLSYKFIGLVGQVERILREDRSHLAPWSERAAERRYDPTYQRDRKLVALLILLICILVFIITRNMAVALIAAVPVLWAISDIWRLRSV